MDFISGSSCNNSVVSNFDYPLTSSSGANSTSSMVKSLSSAAPPPPSHCAPKPPPAPSRYENQKRRDWNTFNQYLKNQRPTPLTLATCSGSHVLEFLKYLDQFGKTKVHSQTCPYFGVPHPPSPCPCPLRQAWGSLDALIGRLRAAYEEHGGKPEANPFGARGVRIYLREVRDYQAKARGVSYDKKRKRSKRKQDGFELQPPRPTKVVQMSSEVV